jgi:hypothetical protein
MGPGGNVDLDPERIFRETGKKIGVIGKMAVNIPGKAAKGGANVLFDAVNMGANGVLKGGKVTPKP